MPDWTVQIFRGASLLQEMIDEFLMPADHKVFNTLDMIRKDLLDIEN